MIRQIEERDLEKAGVLLANVYAKAPWNDSWTSKQATQYLTQLYTSSGFEGFVLEEDQQLLAVAMGHYKTWYDGTRFVLEEFYVSNSRQGNGLGKEFILFLKNHWKINRVVVTELWTGKGYPAEQFYEKNGFFENKEVINMKYVNK